MRDNVTIVGANGEFGQFLQHDILPGAGVSNWNELSATHHVTVVLGYLKNRVTS